jgi:hypothetical protein
MSFKKRIIMGKDKQGTFHPPTGKPSGPGRQTETIVHDPTLDEQVQLENKYGINPDTYKTQGIKISHPNRNTDKDDDGKRSARAKAELDNSGNYTATSGPPHTTPLPITDLSKHTLEELFYYSNDACISAYMPLHRTGADVNDQVNQISFKNIIQRASEVLEWRNYNAADWLTPAYTLLHDDDFWKNTNAAGIAFFIADGFFKYVFLPEASRELLQINHKFLISPLVPYAMDRDYFYVLVISKKQSKLFRANRFEIHYVPIAEMPNGIEDVVHIEEKDDQTLFRSANSGGRSSANYRRMGSGMDEKQNIASYLAEVDSTIRKSVLSNEHVPLLIAGVDYLIPIFKSVTHYNNVWNASITGSHQYDSNQQLHRAALKVMEMYFEERKKKALLEYGNQSTTATTSSIPIDVIRAAAQSRVSTLFMSNDAQQWGTFDEKQDLLVLHDHERPGDDNLADRTVLNTILNGGDVYIVDDHEVPQGGVMAAIMRY